LERKSAIIMPMPPDAMNGWKRFSSSIIVAGPPVSY
jgi:hypothetical protein